MVDPMHFESRAAIYAQARPPYPQALWERIRDLGLLRPGRRAVDLGAGTGQATGPLLEAGLNVVAVEPGLQLASLLRDRFPTAEVIVARAEDVQLSEAVFDLVVAATSIHWMDLDRVLPAVHRALVLDGRLLVWRNVFGDPSVAITPFRERVHDIVARAHRPTREGDPEDADATAARLTRTGLFAVDEISRYQWSIELDDQQIRRLFATFSDWSAHEVDEAAAAARELGGTVVEHYQSWLIVAKPQFR